MASPSKSSEVSFDSIAHLVSGASKEFGVPESLIYGIIRAENSGSPETASKRTSGNPSAVSPAGARGIMQVMPSAVAQARQSGYISADREINLDNLKDQIDVGTAYLKYAMSLSDDPSMVAAIYNAGPKARTMKSLPAETQMYQKKFAAATGGNQSLSPAWSPSSPQNSSFSSGANMDFGSLLAQIMDGGKSTSQGIRQAVDMQQGTDDEIGDLQTEAQVIRQGTVQQAQAVAGLQADLQFQRDSLIEKNQVLMNLNPDDMNNFVAQTMSALNSAGAARETALRGAVGARAEYDKLATTDLLSDPLGYILAQIQLPSAEAKVNETATGLQRAELEETHAAQQLQTRLQLMAAAKSTLVANTSQAAREANIKQAQVNASVATAQLKEEEAKNLGSLSARRMQQLNMLATAERLDDEDEARKLRAEARKFEADKKLEERQQIAQWDQRLAAVSGTLGLVDPMTFDKLKKLGDGKEKQFWLNAMNTGTFGVDFESSVLEFSNRANRQVLNKTGGLGQVITSDKLRESALSLAQSVAGELQASNMGRPAKREDVLHESFSRYKSSLEASLTTRGGQDMSSPNWNDKTRYNPYVINFPALQKSIEMSAQTGNRGALALTQNPVYKYVQTQIQAGGLNGQNLTPDQQQIIISTFIEDVKSRKITKQAAASAIKEYFTAGMAFTDSMNKPTLFGLPKAESYLFTVDESWYPRDGKMAVDLSSQADIENMLMKKATLRIGAKLPTDQVLPTWGDVIPGTGAPSKPYQAQF